MNPYTILIVIIVYFALLYLVSWLTSRKADNNSFFLGNRKSPWFLVSIGMIGASLSGVTFISAPGWVGSSKFFYMQMVLGYFLGYVLIINILLPLYYRLKLTSIYSYLETRFGPVTYKTGASFFLLSRLVGASLRLLLVANVLQYTIFDKLGIPFIVTVLITLALIWVYTFRAGIKTIVWTDTLQTLFMLVAVVLSVIMISRSLNLSFGGLVKTIAGSEYSQIFNFTNWKGGSFFFKQFISGVFVTLTMTGLDQDMMQKNLSCKNLKEAKKNMYWYGFAFVPVNLIFLSLGALLFIFAAKNGIAIPEDKDMLYPAIATGGHLASSLAIIFILGLIAAAYSSADSALTALTTSFTFDILNSKHLDEHTLRKRRIRVHIGMSVVMAIIILIFRVVNNSNIIDTLFRASAFTYGPLLGLYAFGLFSKWKPKEKLVPVVVILTPILSAFLYVFSEELLGGYKFAYEILIVIGALTCLGLWVIRER